MYLKKSIEKVIGRDVLLSDEMSNSIKLWYDAYRDRAPWVKEDVKSLNLCAAISGELARLATIELRSKVHGGRRSIVLNKAYQKFLGNIRIYTEFACAMGGVVFKPYVEDDELKVEIITAKDFYPTSIGSNGEILSAAFCEKKKVDEQVFIRVEHHELTKNGLVITNRAFKTGSLFSLGTEIELSQVEEWSELEPYTFLKGVKKPLFSYFKIPYANNVDIRSPLGVAVFSRAIKVIEEADKQYSRLLWEFEGGELAIDANIDAVKSMENDFSMPKLNKRLFRGIDIDSGGSDLYSVFAPDLRDVSIINGLDQLLIRIEDLCGLARGVFSSTLGNVRTATELKLLRQRTYSSVSDIQKSLSGALSDMIDGMSVLCDIYSLAPNDSYSMSFDFDDSTISDRESEFKERQALLECGVLSKWELRMWYLGESEEEAKRLATEAVVDYKILNETDAEGVKEENAPAT